MTRGKILWSINDGATSLLAQIDPYILSQKIEKAVAFNALKVQTRAIHAWIAFLVDLARPKNSRRRLGESLMLQLQKKNAIKAWRATLEQKREEIWHDVRAAQHLEFQVLRRKSIDSMMIIRRPCH